MKNNAPLLLILFACMTLPLSSQTEIPEWRFGVGAGVSSLRLHKGDFIKRANILIAASEKEATINRSGNHFGWQVNSTVCYSIGNHVRFLGGLGITKTRSKAYRETDYEGHFFGISTYSTIWDTVEQNYLLLDVPLYFRWQIVKEDRPDLAIRFFMDMGLVAELPFANQSSFGRRESNGDYYSGKLKLTKGLFPFFGIGFMGSDKIFLSLTWTFLENDNHDSIDLNYNSTLTRLTINRYF